MEHQLQFLITLEESHLEIFQHSSSIGKCRFLESKMYHRKEYINTFHFGEDGERKIEYFQQQDIYIFLQ